MNEMLLQFIWQYSLYSPSGLTSTSGEKLTIVHPGKRNFNAGPDFSEARVKIGDTLLVGNVELHVRTSDWQKHGHTSDRSYDNIILHVVFEDDTPVANSPFATLVLCPHIPAYVIDQYTNLIQTTQPIACARQLATVNDLTKESWLNRLLAERWETKLKDWEDLLSQSAGDWRSLLYWRMAANFGFRVNETPFIMTARSLPINVLAKHKENITELEALLFGQAGMLDVDFQDEYPNRLKEEYSYLRKKYQLQPIPSHLWKFLRMRPANFPTIRIAQFAALVSRSLHLFSTIVLCTSVKEIHSLLEVQASEYWSDHYTFDERVERKTVKSLGASSIDNIIINTIAPVQFLYAHFQGSPAEQEKALQLLSSIAPEKNNILGYWTDNGWKAENAAQSQALLQLFNNYCSSKRCLECAVGLNIIKKGSANPVRQFSL